MLSTLLLVSLLSAPQIPDKGEVISQGKLTPREIMEVKAYEYHVSPKLLDKIITCESNWNTTLQSKHIYKTDRPREGVKKGQREQSFGLVQIHLPAHPNITKQQALDPEFALDFLAKNVAKGKGMMWSCFPKNVKIITK